MIPTWLGDVLIIGTIYIAILFTKGILIWREVMLKKYDSIKPYSHITKLKCSCGKIIIVYHNLYGTKSGGGTCKCGAKVTVN